jgi:hypothetical protein
MMENRARVFSTGAASAVPDLELQDKRSPFERFDDWLWMEQQSDFENQMKLIPHHCFSWIAEKKEFFKKVWSL